MMEVTQRMMYKKLILTSFSLKESGAVYTVTPCVFNRFMYPQFVGLLESKVTETIITNTKM